VIKTVA